MEKFNDKKYNYLIFELFLDKLLQIPNSIHITMQNYFTNKITHNFNKIWILNQGNINHMTQQGNKQVAEKIREILKK